MASLAFASACGGDERKEASLTFDRYFASFSFDYEPAKDRSELAARSTLVVEATLVDVVDGPVFGESADDPFASRFALFVFHSDLVSVPIEVVFPRPSRVDGNTLQIAAIRNAMPLGVRAVLYLAPFPYVPLSVGEQKLWFGIDQGPMWQVTTPQGFILENPLDEGLDTERSTILPLAAEGGLSDAPSIGADVTAWLPPGGPVVPPELRS